MYKTMKRTDADEEDTDEVDDDGEQKKLSKIKMKWRIVRIDYGGRQKMVDRNASQ